MRGSIAKKIRRGMRYNSKEKAEYEDAFFRRKKIVPEPIPKPGPDASAYERFKFFMAKKFTRMVEKEFILYQRRALGQRDVYLYQKGVYKTLTSKGKRMMKRIYGDSYYGRVVSDSGALSVVSSIGTMGTGGA